jgi:inosose dehydratase
LTIASEHRPARRLAGAPISWGVCEVPGWGLQLPPERVFGEMAGLGLSATELGAVGWLPSDPHDLRALLDGHGLTLVAGFVPLVLHEPSIDATREEARRVASVMARAGADTFVAAIVADEQWSEPYALDERQWGRLVVHLDEVAGVVAAEGLQFVVHSHVGTLVERDAEVQRLVADSEVGWCLDTGHLLIGGTDPARFVREHAEKISHVHLKDVDAGVARRLNGGELTLMQAVQAGLFRPLGQGDAGIEKVVRLLDAHGYGRWLVLEQDAAIAGQEPPVGSGPIADVRQSIAFLNSVAPEREVARP